jgi:hypothetical protein
MYMKAMQGISLYSYSYLNYQKSFVLLIIVYTLSSTKLEIRAEYFLPRSEWLVGEGRGWWKGRGQRGGRRNDLNFVCTYELVKIKKKKKKRKQLLNNSSSRERTGI